MSEAFSEPAPAPEERRRRRPARRVLAVGVGLAVVAAVVVGLLGASGSASLSAGFVVAALTCGTAGLTTLAGAVRDEFRDRPVPRGRIGLGVALLLGAPLLLILAAGAAGAA